MSIEVLLDRLSDGSIAKYRNNVQQLGKNVSGGINVPGLLIAALNSNRRCLFIQPGPSGSRALTVRYKGLGREEYMPSDIILRYPRVISDICRDPSDHEGSLTERVSAVHLNSTSRQDSDACKYSHLETHTSMEE